MKSFDTNSQQKPIIDQNIINDMFGLTSPSANNENTPEQQTPEQQTEQEQPATPEQTTPETATATPATPAETAPSAPSAPSDSSNPSAPSNLSDPSDLSDLSDPSDSSDSSDLSAPPTDPPQDDDIDILYDQLTDLGYSDLGEKKDFHQLMADQNNVVAVYNALKNEQEAGNFEGLGTLEVFRQQVAGVQKAYQQRSQVRQHNTTAAQPLQQVLDTEMQSRGIATPAPQQAQAQEMASLKDGGQLGRGMQNLTKELYNSLSPEDQNYIRQQGVDINALPSEKEMSTDAMTAVRGRQQGQSQADALYRWMQQHEFDMKGTSEQAFRSAMSIYEGRQQIYKSLTEAGVSLPPFRQWNKEMVALNKGGQEDTPQQSLVKSPIFDIAYHADSDIYLAEYGKLTGQRQSTFDSTAAGQWAAAHSYEEQLMVKRTFDAVAKAIAEQQGTKSAAYGSDVAGQNKATDPVRKLTNFIRDQFHKGGEDLSVEELCTAITDYAKKNGISTEEGIGNQLGILNFENFFQSRGGIEIDKAYDRARQKQRQQVLQHEGHPTAVSAPGAPMASLMKGSNEAALLLDVQNTINHVLAEAGLTKMPGIEPNPQLQKEISDTITLASNTLAVKGDGNRNNMRQATKEMSQDDITALSQGMVEDVSKHLAQDIAERVLSKYTYEQQQAIRNLPAFAKFLYSVGDKTIYGTMMKTALNQGVSEQQRMVNGMCDQIVEEELGEGWATMASIAAMALEDPFFKGAGALGNLMTKPFVKMAVGRTARRLMRIGGNKVTEATAKRVATRLVEGKLTTIIAKGAVTSSQTLGLYEGMHAFADNILRGGVVMDEQGNPVTDKNGDPIKESAWKSAWEAYLHGAKGGATVGVVSPLWSKFTGSALAYKPTDKLLTKAGKFSADFFGKVITEGTAFTIPDAIAMATAGNFNAEDYAKALWGSWKFIFAMKAAHAVASIFKKGPSEFREGPQQLVTRSFSNPLSREATLELTGKGYGADIYDLAENLFGGKEIVFKGDGLIQVAEDGKVKLTGNATDGLAIPEQMERFMNDKDISVSTKNEVIQLALGLNGVSFGVPYAMRTEMRQTPEDEWVVETYSSDGTLIKRAFFPSEREAYKAYYELDTISDTNRAALNAKRNDIQARTDTFNNAFRETLRQEEINDADEIQEMRNLVSSGGEPESDTQRQFKETFTRLLEEEQKKARTSERIGQEVAEQYGIDMDSTLKKDPKKLTQRERKAVKELADRLAERPDFIDARNERETLMKAFGDLGRNGTILPDDATQRYLNAIDSLRQALPEGAELPTSIKQVHEMVEQSDDPQFQKKVIDYAKANQAYYGARDRMMETADDTAVQGYVEGETIDTAEKMADLQAQIQQAYNQAAQTAGKDLADQFMAASTKERADMLMRLSQEEAGPLLTLLSLGAKERGAREIRVADAEEQAEATFDRMNGDMDRPFEFTQYTTTDGGQTETRMVHTGTVNGRRVIFTSPEGGSDMANAYDILSGQVTPVRTSDIADPMDITAQEARSAIRTAASADVRRQVEEMTEGARQIIGNESGYKYKRGESFDLKDENGNIITAEVQRYADDGQPLTDEQGNPVTDTVRVKGTFGGFDKDGNAVITTSQPLENNQTVHHLTPEQVDAIDGTEAQARREEAEQQRIQEQVNQEKERRQGEVRQHEQNKAEDAQQENEYYAQQIENTEKAQEQQFEKEADEHIFDVGEPLPRDKDGRPDYMRMTPERHYKYLMEDLYDRDEGDEIDEYQRHQNAQKNINANIKRLQDKKDSLEKKRPEVNPDAADPYAKLNAWKSKMEDIDAQLSHWNKVREIEHARHLDEQRAQADTARNTATIKALEPLTFRQFAMKALYLGGKCLRWSDKGEGQWKQKGLASETGYGKGEKKELQWLIDDKDGASLDSFAERMATEWQEYSSQYGDLDATEARDELLDILSSFANRFELGRLLIEERYKREDEYRQAERDAYEAEMEEAARKMGMTVPQYERHLRKQKEKQEQEQGQRQIPKAGRLGTPAPILSTEWKGHDGEMEHPEAASVPQRQMLFQQGAEAFARAYEKARREGRDITAGDFEREYEDSVGPKIFEEDRQLLQPYFDHFLHKARQDEGLEPKPKAQEDTQATQPTTQKVTDPDDPRIDEARHTAQTLGLNALFTTSDSKVHEGRRMEGTKRAAYGYIDTGTGEIVINTDNCHDAEHVLTTLLHEGVAHYGLRKLFGSDFNTFLDNVYGNCTDDMRRTITERAEKEKAIRQKNGITISDEEALRIGVDEYIASLAEKTDFTAPERTLWNRIKQLFLRMLRTKGIRITTITDDDLRNILREAYKNLKEENGQAEEGTPQPETEASTETPADRTRFMGSRVDKRMADISSKLAGMEMDENQRKVVSVFTGASDNEPISIQRTDGKNVRLILRQGNENRSGSKHSLFRHYGTNSSPYSAKDILSITKTVEKGTRKRKNNNKSIEYRWNDETGSTYFVITDIKNGREEFANFYKTEKVSPTARETPSNQARAVVGDTSSTGKVTKNSPTDQTNPQQSATEQGKNSYSLSSFNPIEQVRTNIERRKIERAEQETDTEPTDAQKEAGNYKKGHIRIDGYDLTIEQPKGSVRRGTDASGKQWEQVMRNTYGYIRGTEGVDGDHIDVFLSDDPSHGDVFVVDQVNKDGSFDEHKVMYGFPDVESARKAYFSNYEDGWQGLGAITPVSKEEFKNWIRSSHRKTKPFAEYSNVKTLSVKEEQGTDRYSHDNEDKKNTALTESTGQFSTDASSGGLVRNAHRSPADTPGVTSDPAKVRIITQKAKNNIKKYGNGDKKITISGNFGKDSKHFRAILGLDYQGNSNYAVYDTPAGRLAFRLANHNAFGDNFARDNADQNISVYVALNEYDQPDSAISYTEYRISPRDYARHKDEFAKSLIESVGTAIETGTFPQPRFTEKVVDGDRDAEYQKAVEQGDWDKVDTMLREEARLRGYSPDTSYQGSIAFNGAAPSKNVYFDTREQRKQAFNNGDFEGDYSLGDFAEAGLDNNDLEWQLTHPIQASGRDTATMESIRNINKALNSGKRTIKIYRAVDADIKENAFRNGDWVTPSREYAERHIGLQEWKKGRIIEQEVPFDDLWWNGDDINEWGYDDGRQYAYKNTPNNRKLLEPTYDNNGNLIPLSQRFNPSNPDIRYSLPLQPANDPALTPEQNRLLSPESLIKLFDNGDSAEHYCDEALGTPYRHVAWGDRLTSFGRFNERRRKEGLHVDFDSDGNLINYGLYHDGRREGMHYTFNPQGDRLIEGAFSNGTRVGTHRVFYDTYSQAPRYDLPGLKPEKREQVRDEITYNQQGRPDGEAYSYSSSGKLLERHIFKNGKLLAEWYAPAYLKSILKSVVSGDEIRIGNMTPHQAWWQLRAYRRNGSTPWIPQGQPGEGQPYKPSETDTADEADKPLHQWNPVQAVKENTQRRQARQLTIDFHEDDTAALSDPSDLSDLSDPSYNPAATRKGRQMPPSMLTDEELLLRTRTEEGSTDDWNLYNDEYDRRHRQEYADLTDHYRDVIEKTSPTLDDAYDMLATADQHFHYGGYASPERTELLAQRDVLQDYIDRKEAEQSEAQQGTDRYSLPEDQQRTDDIIKAAEKHFGTTRDIREAGYILPDGKLLDFSGRHDLEPGTSDRPLRGQRTSDHRDIRQIAFDKDDNPTGITTDMADFIRRGAIRIDANNGAVNLAVKPTEQQRRRLRELVARNEGDIYIDFGDGDNTDHYAEYEGAKPTRILADIDRYFDEGIKPEGVTRYSLPMETPENVKKEMFDIRKQAKSTKTWLKTPNNKSSNLDERQWTQVRTTPFKNWFGDWQTNEARQYILEGEPASSIENKKIMAKPGQTFRQAVAELFQTQGGKANSAFGEVLLDPTGVSNDIQHGMGPIKNATFASVKDVLEKGRVILPMGYYETSGKKQMTGFIAAPINIDGERYVCVVGVIRNKKDNKLYIHEAFSMKKLQLDAASNVVHDGEAVSPHPAGAVAKLVKNILNAKNSSKIVDENGEPLVVYHQTNSTVYINKETGQNWDELDWREKDEWEERDDWDEYWQEQDFYTFDNKNHGRRSIEYPAFFFSPKNDPYHEYGKRTIAVYLNIKNPAINPDIENRGVTNTAGEDAMKKLIEQGYDGVIRTDENGKPYEYIAFFPEQIKSATDNIGSFSPTNGDIRFSLPGADLLSSPSSDLPDLSTWNPLDTSRANIERARRARREAAEAQAQHRAGREQAIAAHTAIKDDPNITPARKNRLQNDIIRKVADIRSMVSKVREGDRESVRAVTQTVLAMADAVGDGLTRGAVKRIMHAVENATTRRDVKTEVDKAVNVILNQVTHEVEKTKQKLLKTKSTKLDPNNIRVAGQLDEHGQRSLRQLNDLLSPEGKATDIDTLEAKLSSDAQSTRQVTAGNAKDKLVGVKLARLHRETVEAVQQEIDNLIQQRRDLEDEIYDTDTDDNGKVISKRLKPEYARKDIDPADKTYRERIESQIEAVNEALQESRVELINYTANFNEQLGMMIQGGKQARKAWAEQQRQREDNIMHDANRDLYGITSNPYENTRRTRERIMKGKRPTTLSERIGHWFSYTFGAPFHTFDTYLRKFGRMSPNGEGYLFHRFSKQWTDSATRLWTETKKDKAIMDGIVRDLFGEDYGAKHYKDIYTVCEKMDAQRRKEGKAILLDYTDPNGENPVRIEIGTGQALYIILADQQTDGRMKLRAQGITEDNVQKLRDVLDPRILQLGDWMVNDFLPAKREWYNQTYKRIFGADMKENPNYFPIRVFDNARHQATDTAEKDRDNNLPSTTTGSIVERTRNSLPLDPTADAFDMLADHIRQMNDWASWAEMRKDLNALCSNTAFRNKVENMKASLSLGTGKDMFQNFKTTCALATGAYKPEAGWGSKFLVSVSKNITAAKISFRVHTAIKQLLSHGAFWAEAKPGELLKAFLNFNGTWEWAMRNLPLLESRFQSRTMGDTRLADTSANMMESIKSVTDWLSKYGMLTNASIDAYTCAAGAKAVYDARMRYYTKQLELSHDDAHRRAVIDATVAFNQSQQSSEGMFVSPIQKDRDFASVMLTTFRNGPMGYGRQLRNTISDLRTIYGTDKELLIDHRKRQLMEEYGLSEDKALQQARKDLARRKRKDWSRLAVYGYVVGLMWNMGSNMFYYLLGQDYDKKAQDLKDDALHAVMTSVEGLAGGNWLSDLWNNKVVKGDKWSYTNLLSLPMQDDIEKVMEGLDRKDQVPAYANVINLIAQGVTGVNLATLTDIYAAVADAVEGYKGAQDLKDVATETALAVLRAYQTPTSVTENLYIDQLKGKDRNIDMKKTEHFCKRFVEFKKMKDGDGFLYELYDEAMEHADKRYEKRYNDLIASRPSYFKQYVEEQAVREMVTKRTPKEEEGEKDKQKLESGKKLFQKHASMSAVNAYLDLREQIKEIDKQLEERPNGQTDRKGYRQWNLDHPDIAEKAKALKDTRKQINAIFKDMSDSTLIDDLQRISVILNVPLEE